MRSIRVVLAVVTALALTGCINSTTLIKVKPDGSGTVEQTTLMNVGGAQGDDAGRRPTRRPRPREQGRPRAHRRADGQGRAAGVGRADEGRNGFEGVKAIFAFDDINQVQVSQDPNMSGSTSGAFAPEPTADDPVRFTLTRTGRHVDADDRFRDKPGGRRHGRRPQPTACPT